MRILLAIDGSRCSDVAVSSVSKRPWPAGSIVRVVNVIEPVTLPVPEAVTMPESCYEVMRRRALLILKRAVDVLKQPGTLQIQTITRIGSAEAVILEEAEVWHADLIVLGSHGKGRAERFLLGSVSQAVALRAQCSVEIMRRENDSRVAKQKRALVATG